ncbi:MAG: formylglycine-generating enzyme family protein [archaeon]
MNQLKNNLFIVYKKCIKNKNNITTLDLFFNYEYFTNILTAYVLNKMHKKEAISYMNLYKTSKPTFGNIFYRFKEVFDSIDVTRFPIFQELNKNDIFFKEFFNFLEDYNFYDEVIIMNDNTDKNLLIDFLKIILYLRNLYIHQRFTYIEETNELLNKIYLEIINSVQGFYFNDEDIFIKIVNNQILFLNCIEEERLIYKNPQYHDIQVEKPKNYKSIYNNKVTSNVNKKFSGIEFIKVPSGVISLKSYSSDKYDDYYIDSFWISKYPITYEMFSIFLNDKPNYLQKRMKNYQFLKNYRIMSFNERLYYNNSAVYYIDWNDCIEFCNWLSLQKELELVYENNKSNIGKNGFRLPSEIEWYYASTCGGKDIQKPKLNRLIYRNNRGYNGKTQLNSKLYSNSWGICGMLGNINEWTNSDSFKIRIKKFEKDGKIKKRKIIKGGSFASSSNLITHDYSTDVNIDNLHYIGFRIIINDIK